MHLTPYIPMPKEERIVLLSRILESHGEILEGVRGAHWSMIMACIMDACHRLDYSWELSWDHGKRITGEHLHDGDRMLTYDEVEAGVDAGEIPIMLESDKKGYHVSLAQWGRSEPLPNIRAAVTWLLVTLLDAAREEWEKLTDGQS